MGDSHLLLMPQRQGSRMLQENRPSLHVAPVLADAFVEGYLCWRDESAAVESAYAQWRGMEQHDRTVAFAAYRAALDREEHAARIFRECTERVFGPTE